MSKNGEHRRMARTHPNVPWTATAMNHWIIPTCWNREELSRSSWTNSLVETNNC